MRTQRLLLSILALTLLVGSLLISPTVHAIEPEELQQTQETTEDIQITLTPTSARFELNPGSVEQGTITILNTGRKSFEFNVYAAPYQVTNDEYNPTFDRDVERTQIARWISFPEGSQFTLDYNHQIKIPYSITVPDDVPDGGQYAVLFAETSGKETTPDEQSSGITSKQRVGTVIYAAIAGTTRESGSVQGSRTAWWQFSAPLTSAWYVKNDGNTDFVAKTSMKVMTLGGKTVYQSQSPKELSVLPDTTRKITEQWDDASRGIYKVETTIEVTGKTTVKSTYVLVASPVFIINILLIIGASVVAIIAIHHQKKPRKKKKR